MSCFGRARHIRAAPVLPALILAACATSQVPEPSVPSTALVPSVAPRATLSPSATPALDPEDSAEGKIAYMRIHGNEYPGEVVVRELADGTERVIVESGFPIAFTLDGSGLFVAEPIEEPQQRLLLYPTDGGEPTELLDNVFIAFAPPSTSPDGRFVALASDGAAPNGLVVLDLAAGTASQLTTDGGQGRPRWSPDSRWLAYHAVSPGTGWTDLYMVDVTGDPPQRMTNDRITDVPMGWTDNGASVIVARYATIDPTSQTALLDVVTGALTEAPELFDSSTPARSPDGRWELVVRTNASELRPVGGSSSDGRVLPGTDDAEFTWSPDGAWLVWSGRADGSLHPPNLFMLRVPDGEVIRLTHTEAEEVMPVWGGATVRPGQ